MPICSRCREEKSVDLFVKSTRTKSGRGCWCKQCISTASLVAKARRAAGIPDQRLAGPLPSDQMLSCTRCGERKPDDGFAVAKLNKGRRFRSSHCRKCLSAGVLASRQKHIERYRAYEASEAGKAAKKRAHAKFRAANPDKVRAWKTRHHEIERAAKFGLSVVQLRMLFDLQDGLCKICGRALVYKTAHVDHCHTTERFRGFLCPGCNHVLGHARDSPAILRAAADYLER